MHKDQDKYSNNEFDLEELSFIDQMLKESLEDDFEVSIPLDFADQVTEVIEKRKSIREALLKHLIMSLGLITILAFAVGFLFYLGKNEADMILNFAIKFKYPIAFILFTILSIQLADSFLLSRTKEQLEE
jgi:hypothetical protein